MPFSNSPFPTLTELRSMAQGAAIGARMAVGPTRWVELRGFIDLVGAVFLGWFTLPIFLFVWPHIHRIGG